jgi:cell division protein FtsI (penicillin-binding protein 3)
MTPTSADRRLLVYVALVLFGLFACLVVQFYKLQIVEGDKWKKRAFCQHRLSVVEPYRRGLFYSNTSVKPGHPDKDFAFVVDVPRFHLYADPRALPTKWHKEIVYTVQKILRLSPDDGQNLKLQLQKKSHSRKLVLWMTKEMHDQIMKWWTPFAKVHKIPRNALFCVQDHQRLYPGGSLLGQLLHAVRAEREISTHQCIPTGGLELSLDRYLKGEDGKRLILRSPRQPLETGTVTKMPQHGADVYLTINHHLQAMAEEEIAKAVKAANAATGWAIMMDPYTGEILAWAQYPFFEPGKYRDYFNDPKKLEATKVKAITDPYEPGSTMKPITLAVCLKANAELKRQGKPPLFSIQEKVPTAVGHFPGRGKPLKDLNKVHKFLNMPMAMQKSSNIYMALMVQRVIQTLGDAWYLNALSEIFGFGVKTGIELKGESSGLLPRLGKTHPNGSLEYSRATPPSLAMGHNILTTSLQMLKPYAAIANGGFAVQPTLVRKIVKKDGEVILDNTLPKPLKRILEPEIVAELATAMRYTTKVGGTSRRANILGYTEAGKTGSSEKVINGVYSKKNHISTFMGYAPAVNPRFVMLVAIDEPEYKYIPGVGRNQLGGICTGPCFSALGLRALQYLGVPPDDPDNKAWDKENQQLKALYDQWNQ